MGHSPWQQDEDVGGLNDHRFSGDYDYVRILFIHDLLPRADKSGSELRVAQIVQELRSQGHEVTYVGRFGECERGYRESMEEMGVQVFSHDAQRLRFLGIDVFEQWRFEQVLQEHKYDVAFLTLWFWNGISIPEHYLEPIRRLAPDTKIVIVSDDLHGIRESQLAERTLEAVDWERAFDYEDREVSIYRAADLVVAVSDSDRTKLQKLVPELEIALLPMVAQGVDCDQRFEEREGLIFLGDFENTANNDAMAWFLTECWPDIRRRLGDISFHIVGHKAPKYLMGLGNGVLCEGHAADLQPMFSKARVFVCPMLFGTGVATKNLVALRHNVPVVTTTAGSLGVGLANDVTALICDVPHAFSDAVVRLYTDRTLWARLSAAGRQQVLSVFSHNNQQSAVRNILNKLSFRASKSSPKKEWSSLLVEQYNPNVLTHRPAHDRLPQRCCSYLQLAGEFLARGEPQAALAQVRHTLSFFRTKEQAGELYSAVAAKMTECYLKLNDSEGVERWRNQMQGRDLAARAIR